VVVTQNRSESQWWWQCTDDRLILIVMLTVSISVINMRILFRIWNIPVRRFCRFLFTVVEVFNWFGDWWHSFVLSLGCWILSDFCYSFLFQNLFTLSSLCICSIFDRHHWIFFSILFSKCNQLVPGVLCVRSMVGYLCSFYDTFMGVYVLLNISKKLVLAFCGPKISSVL
jgi:hypothetical protein